MKSVRRVILAFTLGVAGVGTASADVQFSISPEPYYVGAPLRLSITVNNEPNHDPPKFPEIAWGDVRDAGTQSRQTIINGVMTQSVIYQYDVIPRQAGRLVMLPIEITVDGETRQTQPKTIEVEKTESEGLLYVEVHGDRESIYLGQSVELTLEVWLEPFLDRRNNFGTSVDMQGCIDFRSSTWGPFANALQQLRRLPVRRGKRADADGNEQDYYVFHLEREIWPEKTGLLTMSDVNIVVQYPLEVARDRSFFFSEARVVRARPISAQAEVDPIVVKPIPTAGQPPGYNGAVGRYEFDVTAKPTDVRVGDPITLTMTIRGGGRLDLLRAPRLAEIEGLTAGFQVPDEELAGVAADGAKQFTQSIRAKTDAVTEVPPIPFAYFDPETEQFVVLASEPIPLAVKASERTAVSQIVESQDGGPVAATRLTELSQGILANYTDMNEVLGPDEFRLGPATLTVTLASPLLFLLCWATSRRADRLRNDEAYARRRQAKRNALRAVADAERSTQPAAQLADALTGYVADRLALPSGGLTRLEAVDALRHRQAASQLVERTDALLQECENIRYAGVSDDDVDTLAGRVRQCIAELERKRF